MPINKCNNKSILFQFFSVGCSDGNVTFLQLDYKKKYFSRICKYDLYHNRPYYTSYNKAHIEYRSGLLSSKDPSKGFSMSFISVDINECEEGAKCSQKCINTPGSYVCTCNPGYFLSADGHTCFGKKTIIFPKTYKNDSIPTGFLILHFFYDYCY